MNTITRLMPKIASARPAVRLRATGTSTTNAAPKTVPGIEPDPPTITARINVIDHSSPKSNGPTWVTTVPSRAPPKPAMPEDTAKATTFWRLTATPIAAAATGASRIATQ